MGDAAARALGRKVAFHRAQRGLSQRDFGAMIDRSETWVSQVERGVRRIDRMTVLRVVADTLGVPLNELAADTPVVASVKPLADPAPELRMLLSSSLALSLAVGKQRPVGYAAVGREAARVGELTHQASYGELVPLLVELIPRLERASRTVPKEMRPGVDADLARTYHACAALLSKLGETASAWIAADRSIAAAERAGDPLLMAAGAFRLAIVFQGDRRHEQAEHTARTAVDALDPLVKAGTPEALSVAGALRLQLAVVFARVNESDRAYAELARARALAEMLGSDRNDYGTEFGPTNVGLHEVSVAVDLGDAGTALRIAAGLNATPLSEERRARLLVDIARAHLQRKNPDGVVRALIEAERIAPELIREHRLVKNILYDVARSDLRSDPRVRGLAQRCGVFVR